MSAREKLLGRLGKLGSEALISAANLKREIETQSLDRLERLAKRLKLVKREEFEALQAMLRQARENQEKILNRLTHIEAKLGIKPAPQARAEPPRRKKKN